MQHSGTPKISVIIPVYNRENYLHACIDSILNQTINDIEIIFVNDGSTDKSLDIINEYAIKDNRIKIINQTNTNAGNARNHGISIASGEYLGFVDSDDRIKPEMYETLYNQAKTNDYDIVECDYIKHYKYSNEQKEIYLKNEVYKSAGVKLKPYNLYTPNEIEKSLLNGYFSGPCFRIIKRDLVIQNNITFGNLNSGEDIIFTLDAILSSSKICYVDKPMYYYQIHGESTVNSSSNVHYDVFTLVEEIAKILYKHNKYEDLKNNYQKFKILSLVGNFDKVPESEQENFIKKAKEVLNNNEFNKFIKLITHKNSFAEEIFSVKNIMKNGAKHKVITILGIKFQIKSGKAGL